jgi:lysophospholipase L1-like esterase
LLSNTFLKRCGLIAIGCVFAVLFAIIIPIIFSQPVRRAYLHMVDRQIAKRVPPEFVFVGDSLTENANWGWMLSRNPFAAVNLAEPGATIGGVSVQVNKARAFNAAFLMLLVGTNDLLMHHHPFSQIVCAYTYLLESAPTNSKLIITLIPYTSFPEHTREISALNSEIAELAKRKSAMLINLNPYIAPHGVLTANFTTDGIHFNREAYQIWADQLRAGLK